MHASNANYVSIDIAVTVVEAYLHIELYCMLLLVRGVYVYIVGNISILYYYLISIGHTGDKEDGIIFIPEIIILIHYFINYNLSNYISFNCY